MPDAVPHLGVLDGNNDPFRFIENVSVFPRSRRKADVTGLGFNRLTVSIGYKMACIAFCAILFVADLVAIRIVHVNLHVTPRIDGSPTEATPNKSCSA